MCGFVLTKELIFKKKKKKTLVERRKGTEASGDGKESKGLQKKMEGGRKEELAHRDFKLNEIGR